MPYIIARHNRLKKNIKKYRDPKDEKAIKEALKKIWDNPLEVGEPLKGENEELFKVVVNKGKNNFRILFRFFSIEFCCHLLRSEESEMANMLENLGIDPDEESLREYDGLIYIFLIDTREAFNNIYNSNLRLRSKI